MITPQQIKELKQVSIVNYLFGKGINPSSKSSAYFMYHSPLRNDSTPSFSVDPINNTFYDLGNESDKGNIIELVMRMECMGFVEACNFLGSNDLMKEKDAPISLSLSHTSENTVKDYQITAVKHLQHPALIRYVESRRISLRTAFTYLSEIHYSNSKGKFFGVGYQTDNGGYVLRSGIMQKPMNLGKTGIKTFAVPESKEITVFEGMFDFLACVELCKCPPRYTAIVLNSVSNLSKALPQLSEAKKIYGYLDNDLAGRNATQKIKDSGFNILDKSAFYEGYKDLSEFWSMRNKSS